MRSNVFLSVLLSALIAVSTFSFAQEGSVPGLQVRNLLVTEIEEGWSRLKMTSPGEVQGVRFLSGAIIDAKPEDAEKLIRAGKAVRVDENGNIIDLNEDDFDNQDEAGSGAEAEDRTEDENGNHEARDSDNAETKENTPSAMTDEQTAEAENDEQPVMAVADDASSDDAASAEAEPPVSPDDESSDNADNKT